MNEVDRCFVLSGVFFFFVCAFFGVFSCLQLIFFVCLLITASCVFLSFLTCWLRKGGAVQEM